MLHAGKYHRLRKSREHSCDCAIQPQPIAVQWDQHSELIATESSDAAVGLEGGLKPRGNLFQQVVSRRVSEDVVGLLEAVLINQANGEVLTAACRRREQGLQALVELETVRQPRQTVQLLSLIHISEPTRRTPISYA